MIRRLENAVLISALIGGFIVFSIPFYIGSKLIHILDHPETDDDDS